MLYKKVIHITWVGTALGVQRKCEPNMEIESKLNCCQEAAAELAHCTSLSTRCLVRFTQLICMSFECTVGLDHPLEVLVTPVRDWRTTATCSQSVHHTLCPHPVGTQWGATITCVAGIALCLCEAHAKGNESCCLENHCDQRVKLLYESNVLSQLE